MKPLPPTLIILASWLLVSAYAMAETSKTEEQDMTAKRELLQKMYSDELKTEGYAPQIDKDGDVLFKFEGKTYYIDVKAAASDPQFFKIVLPNMWVLNDNDHAMALVAAEHAGRNIKVVKVMLHGNRVSFVCEIFLPEQEDFKKVYKRCLSALGSSAQAFAGKMREEIKTGDAGKTPESSTKQPGKTPNPAVKRSTR